MMNNLASKEVKKYPSYRDSGNPWLGQMPEHWKVVRLQNILRSTAERDRPALPLLSVVREKGVILRDSEDSEENHNVIPEDLRNYKVVREGQFAMNKMKAWQGSYGVSPYEGIVSPAYFTFSIAGVNGKFLHSALRSREYVRFFTQASDGVRIGQWDLSPSRMREIPVLVPPPDEQAAIVRYLDDTDQRIRDYVSAKERLIALLEEERQAVIHQAVTRGLNPNVRLEPSGVEWLGEVPEHWDVRRIRTLGQAIIGLTYSPQDMTDAEAGSLVLRASNISGGRVVDADNVYVRCEIPDKLLLTEGDILICSRSGSRNLIGKNARIDSESAGATFGAFMTILRGPNNDYLHQVFNSKLFEYQSGAFLTSTINQLTLGILNDMKIPFPPLEEREAILDHVKESTESLDAAIDRARRQIELMEEYRTRLIADVVTGQIDVRGT